MKFNFQIQIDDYEAFDEACTSAVRQWEHLPIQLRVDGVRAWYQWANAHYPAWLRRWLMEKPRFDEFDSKELDQ